MKKPKKTAALLLTAFAFAFAAAGCGKANIGYVDRERLASEAPQVKSIMDEGNAKLQKESEKLQQKMAANPQMSQEDAQKAQADTQQKLQSINQSYQQQMKQKIDAAMKGISKEKKLDVIVSDHNGQKTPLYGYTDVTDEAIAKLQ